MKFKRVYMFGGTSGKDDPTDYLIGYECENGKYIDKRTSALDCQVWYEVDGWPFDSLKDAKAYVTKF